MSVFQSIATRADNTSLTKVIVTNLANPQLDTDHQVNSLHFNDTGYNGGIANSINVNVVPCSACQTSPAVIFDKYWTSTGNVFASMDWLEFISTVVSSSGQFQNNYYNVQLSSKKGDLTPWYMFIVGDHIATNADSIEHVFRNQVNSHSYNWVQPPGTVINYLLSLYGF
jgi:hypothetical protein